jgi:hypothetical protein
MSRPDRTQAAIDLLESISREFNVDVKTLRDRGKHALDRRYVAIRRIYCKRGRSLGLTVTELGISLNRDHSTISYHAHDGARARKKASRSVWDQRRRSGPDGLRPRLRTTMAAAIETLIEVQAGKAVRS